eukprot:491696-Prorocentrum_minimum.AAC.1
MTDTLLPGDVCSLVRQSNEGAYTGERSVGHGALKRCNIAPPVRTSVLRDIPLAFRVSTARSPPAEKGSTVTQ